MRRHPHRLRMGRGSIMSRMEQVRRLSFYMRLHGLAVPLISRLRPSKRASNVFCTTHVVIPLSDVASSVEFYSEDTAATDAGAILDALGLRDAHLVGVSMGSAAALQFTLRSASRVRSLTLCSIGAGSDLKPGEFANRMEAFAKRIETSDPQTLADLLGSSPDRQRLREKNPIEFRKFMEQASGLSRVGLANTFRGVQARRPPIYAHKDGVAALTTPTLLVVGELDVQCTKPSQFLAETIRGARLETLAGTGHSVNIEEPAIINRLVADFVDAAEGRRTSR